MFVIETYIRRNSNNLCIQIGLFELWCKNTANDIYFIWCILGYIIRHFLKKFIERFMTVLVSLSLSLSLYIYIYILIFMKSCPFCCFQRSVFNNHNVCTMWNYVFMTVWKAKLLCLYCLYTPDIFKNIHEDHVLLKTYVGVFYPKWFNFDNKMWFWNI